METITLALSVLPRLWLGTLVFSNSHLCEPEIRFWFWTCVRHLPPLSVAKTGRDREIKSLQSHAPASLSRDHGTMIP